MTDWILPPQAGVRRTTPEERRRFYNEVRELSKKYSDAPFTRGLFVFDKETEVVRGSNVGYEILGAQTSLYKGRTLSWQDWMNLDGIKALSNGVFRTMGLAVFTPSGGNKMASTLAEEAKKRKWDLPVLAGVASLSLNTDGTEVQFNDDSSRIIYGEEARNYLNSFNFVGSVDARSVGRGWYGGWNADWFGVFSSDADCRMAEFVRGVPSVAEGLEEDSRMYSLEGVIRALIGAGVEGDLRNRVIAGLPTDIVQN